MGYLHAIPPLQAVKAFFVQLLRRVCAVVVKWVDKRQGPLIVLTSTDGPALRTETPKPLLGLRIAGWEER